MAEQKRGSLLDRLFELRAIVAVLFGVYGIVCVVWGLGFTTAAELKKAAGINVNLLTGIAMVVFAAAFAAWALLKPLEEERVGSDETPIDADQH